METKQVSLVNAVGCKLEAELTQEELNQFLSNGWRVADKSQKVAVANLVRFGV